MNTLIAVAIAPCGTGDEFAPYVAEIVRIIRESGLPNRTNSMFTRSRLESRYPTGIHEYDEQQDQGRRRYIEKIT